MQFRVQKLKEGQDLKWGEESHTRALCIFVGSKIIISMVYLWFYFICVLPFTITLKENIHRYTYTMQGKKKAFVKFNSRQVKATSKCHLHSSNTTNLITFTKIYSCFPWLINQEALWWICFFLSFFLYKGDYLISFHIFHR